MNKEELVSQLTALVEGYTDGLVSANCRLVNSGYKLKEEKREWEQKYHTVIAANKNLEEQNGILMQDKQALRDILAEFKSENQSLAALNETLSTESQNWQGQCAELRGKYSSVLKELAEKESSWSKAFAAAEERHEDFKKRSDGILATMGENLQKKQEQIEALTTWKEGTEEVLNSMEEKLRDYETASKVNSETIELLGTQKDELRVQLEALKQVNYFQEHRIEVLFRKANKLRKKEQND